MRNMISRAMRSRISSIEPKSMEENLKEESLLRILSTITILSSTKSTGCYGDCALGHDLSITTIIGKPRLLWRKQAICKRIWTYRRDTIRLQPISRATMRIGTAYISYKSSIEKVKKNL
jgi:hypothetical protein